MSAFERSGRSGNLVWRCIVQTPATVRRTEKLTVVRLLLQTGYRTVMDGPIDDAVLMWCLFSMRVFANRTFGTGSDWLVLIVRR